MKKNSFIEPYLKRNSKPTALYFLAGISVGAILGILLAPDRGSETRALASLVAEDLGLSTFQKK
jgi:gas vesicle protein